MPPASVYMRVEKCTKKYSCFKELTFRLEHIGDSAALLLNFLMELMFVVNLARLSKYDKRKFQPTMASGSSERPR